MAVTKFYPPISSIVSVENLPGQSGFVKDGGPNTNTNSFPIHTISGEAKPGSGGNYLSNEIFYRIAKLRQTNGNLARTGHFHIPSPEDRKVFPATIQEIFNKVKNAITRSIPDL